MVRLTDRPDMTLDVYCGRKTTKQQQLNRRIETVQMRVSQHMVSVRNKKSYASFIFKYPLLSAALVCHLFSILDCSPVKNDN